MSLDVRKIRYFIALFEEGSVNRAAERENIVQPALSTQLKQLEQELSIQLFERSAQGLQPTRAGQHFYRLCLGLMRDLRAARQEMLDFGTTVRGAIHVGMMTSICHGCFGETLMRYCEAHPDVHVTIVEGTSGILADRVVLGTLDFAVCNRPASHTGLKLRRVFSDKFFL
ncbi:MAG: LysR family transcriptional regulator, partial [Luteimonas sp.]|nr:LysR family transcriptional regulator [Luteimonas sp.]